MTFKEQLDLYQNNPRTRLKILKIDAVMTRFFAFFLNEDKKIKYFERLGERVNGELDFIIKSNNYNWEIVEMISKVCGYNAEEQKKIDKLFCEFKFFKFFRYKTIFKNNANKCVYDYYNYILKSICLIEDYLDFEDEKLLMKTLE